LTINLTENNGIGFTLSLHKKNWQETLSESRARAAAEVVQLLAFVAHFAEIEGIGFLDLFPEKIETDSSGFYRFH